MWETQKSIEILGQTVKAPGRQGRRRCCDAAVLYPYGEEDKSPRTQYFGMHGRSQIPLKRDLRENIPLIFVSLYDMKRSMSNHTRPLTGLLSWEKVDELIERIKPLGPWYIFSPTEGIESLFQTNGEEAAKFLSERTEELKTRPHGPGWIYVHTPAAPSWIKIYDPCKCGSSCSMTTPPAWWEMELTDPRPRLEPVSSEEEEKKTLFGWWKGKKTEDSKA
jgi:hypothetical protein